VKANSDGTLAPRFGGAVTVPGVRAAAGAALTLGVRPEHLSLDNKPGALGLPVTVQQIEQLGGLSLIYGALPGDDGRVTVQCAGQVNTQLGETVTAYAAPESCHVFETDEAGRALRT
jgi:multiple sugar transport system ATP-binding protein